MIGSMYFSVSGQVSTQCPVVPFFPFWEGCPFKVNQPNKDGRLSLPFALGEFMYLFFVSTKMGNIGFSKQTVPSPHRFSDVQTTMTHADTIQEAVEVRM